MWHIGINVIMMISLHLVLILIFFTKQALLKILHLFKMYSKNSMLQVISMKKKSFNFTAVMTKNFYLTDMSRVFVLIVMRLISIQIFAKVAVGFLKKYLIQGVLFVDRLLLKKRRLISFSSLKLLVIHYTNGLMKMTI